MKTCGVERQPPRLPTSMIFAPGRTCARHARETSSSTSTTSASPSARTAFSVSNSGSPGPAPTRNTFASRVEAMGSGCRRVLHRLGEHAVRRDPRLLDVGRERLPKAMIERPEERGSDRVVVLRLDAVGLVPPAELLH